MAKSFISSYAGIALNKLEISNEDREMYYRWFRGEMSKAIAERIITAECFPASLWKNLTYLLESEEKFINEQNGFVSKIKKINASHIGIFCCGNYGLTVHTMLVKGGLNNDFFFDNNNEVWGEELDGIPIVSPEKIADYHKDILIIIANELHHTSILEQVKSYEVPADRIIVFNG